MLKRSRRELPNINERLLKHEQLRVIAQDNSHLGIQNTRKALEMAKDLELDLIMVTEASIPPVARIDDYGRWKYQQNKLKREHKPKKQETKTLKISPRISDHDLATVCKKASKFLSEGDEVKLICQFKAREMEHTHVGRERMEKLMQDLGPDIRVKTPLKQEGRAMTAMILPPKS